MILLSCSQALLPALRQSTVHHFSDNTHAHFSGDSHHHYYANRHIMTRSPGIIGSLVYAVEFGVLEFVSETVVTSLRTGLRRLIPQLYADKKALLSEELSLKKSIVENKLSLLNVREKEQALLERTGALIAQNQKQLALLQNQPLNPEQREQCARLAKQNIELLEMHTHQLRNYLKTQEKPAP
jgi:hypothetical protein